MPHMGKDIYYFKLFLFNVFQYIIDTVIVIMGYNVTFQCITCNDQIRVISISITSSIYPFSVLRTFRTLSVCYFEIKNFYQLPYSAVEH